MNKLTRLSLLAILAGSAFAAEAPQYNVISLQAEARRDVPNDLAQATLYVEFSDASAATLSDKLNRAATDALKIAKAYPGVKASSGNNNVYPVYNNKNKADGWRGRADIRLESTDFKAVAELIGKLQNNMQLDGMSFGVAPATREKVETELIDEAVKAFRGRADVVKKSVGGKGYKLVNISVNTSGSYPQPMARPRMYAAKAMMSAEVAAPPMEGGDSQVVVGVAGSIQVE
ncbi:SIMPL domain-containing protein [Chitinimonas naiadis]